MAVSERDPHSGHMTTGHEWNGIKELNTPVPKAVWLFLIVTVIFSIGYWLLMPAWPLGKTYTRGLLGSDDKEIVTRHVDAAADARSRWTQRIATLGYDQIRADPALMAYVREDGHRLFGDNCAACHGINATGNPGFPNLVDRDWLWGGSADAIAHTIAVGVNSPTSKDSRISQMMAFGKDGMLDNDAVFAVADYVKTLSDPAWAKGKAASVAKGREVFAANCVVCHGEQGRGNPDVGAPNLADQSWVYGGDIGAIYQTIYEGRQGEMPAWEHRLSPIDRKILIMFVLDKGGK
ncbi:cytochrome c oxidase cbb3-type subunit III [Caenibius tardaugens NBRC 16725]|uniref:Cbb3-type cytochrome c oxidase subunit n=1 Tax=Caenibius tardaugens NBRC 16725 TaxID=1219035 RepID=U3A7Z8_9SPHN|nr:cytochrome-c oxidase, cbb3-type subunit III [Caenibius tardaugens]AZI36333.1 cytochrome-c oxidase, cbb3-type subunit III [Caenibius tardaugens NBRC 16725]GAD50868.1 cytochrome c oxidase cbb3-type subunit III [Caenibius tardaugens NBRC 16725]